MTHAEMQEARREAAAKRSRDYRARQRAGELVVMVAVPPDVVGAFQRLGLLPRGGRDPQAVANAAAQFLAAAPGLVAIGEALFPPGAPHSDPNRAR